MKIITIKNILPKPQIAFVFGFMDKCMESELVFRPKIWLTGDRTESGIRIKFNGIVSNAKRREFITHMIIGEPWLEFRSSLYPAG
jgi:hypothetical protein